MRPVWQKTGTSPGRSGRSFATTPGRTPPGCGVGHCSMAKATAAMPPMSVHRCRHVGHGRCAGGEPSMTRVLALSTASRTACSADWGSGLWLGQSGRLDKSPARHPMCKRCGRLQPGHKKESALPGARHTTQSPSCGAPSSPPPTARSSTVASSTSISLPTAAGCCSATEVSAIAPIHCATQHSAKLAPLAVSSQTRLARLAPAAAPSSGSCGGGPRGSPGSAQAMERRAEAR